MFLCTFHTYIKNNVSAWVVFFKKIVNYSLISEQEKQTGVFCERIQSTSSSMNSEGNFVLNSTIHARNARLQREFLHWNIQEKVRSCSTGWAKVLKRAEKEVNPKNTNRKISGSICPSKARILGGIQCHWSSETRIPFLKTIPSYLMKPCQP